MERLFESLAENVSEACYDEIMGIVEEIIGEASKVQGFINKITGKQGLKGYRENPNLYTAVIQRKTNQAGEIATKLNNSVNKAFSGWKSGNKQQGREGTKETLKMTGREARKKLNNFIEGAERIQKRRR